MNRRNDDFGHLPVNSKNENNPCFECGVMTKGKHHVVPVSKGGTKVIPLCEQCHNLIHEGLIISGMIREGLRKAREKNIQLGAPRKINQEKIDSAIKLRLEGKSFKEISKLLCLSVGSVHAMVSSSKA